MDDAIIVDADEVDEAGTSQAVACLAETARQLKEMADYLHELAQQPIGDSRTRH